MQAFLKNKINTYEFRNDRQIILVTLEQFILLKVTFSNVTSSHIKKQLSLAYIYHIESFHKTLSVGGVTYFLLDITAQFKGLH